MTKFIKLTRKYDNGASVYINPSGIISVAHHQNSECTRILMWGQCSSVMKNTEEEWVTETPGEVIAQIETL